MTPPQVRIIPPLIYLAGLGIGFLANLWMPIKVVGDLMEWVPGGVLIVCGAALAGSAVWRFKSAGTNVRPDRPVSKFVIAGPYRFTRNPMYLGLALVYAGIAIAGQIVWELVLLPAVLTLIRRMAIDPEEAYLKLHLIRRSMNAIHSGVYRAGDQARESERCGSDPERNSGFGSIVQATALQPVRSVSRT